MKFTYGDTVFMDSVSEGVYEIKHHLRKGKVVVEFNRESRVRCIKYFFEKEGNYKERIEYRDGGLLICELNDSNKRTRRFEKSRMIEELNYSNGRLHGSCKSFYPSGKIKQTINYCHGLQVGESILYYDEGFKKEEYIYSHDSICNLKSRKNSIWFSDDEVHFTKKNDTLGEIVFVSQRFFLEYYSSGTLKKNIFVESERTIIEIEYDEVGNEISKIKFVLKGSNNQGVYIWGNE